MEPRALGLLPVVSVVASALALASWSIPARAERSESPCAVGRVLEVSGRVFVDSGVGLEALDTTEGLCLGCHDGTIASAVTKSSGEVLAPRSEILSLGLPSAGSGAGSYPGANHPVGMPYPEDGPALVPRYRLDPRLRLEGGVVGCSTCHGDPDAPGALSISNHGSALCLSCHEK